MTKGMEQSEDVQEQEGKSKGGWQRSYPNHRADSDWSFNMHQVLLKETEPGAEAGVGFWNSLEMWCS
jgi:hypothetical protein